MWIVNPALDNAYPRNTKFKVLKNVSQRSMQTFYKLSDKYSKSKKGVLSQSIKANHHLFHKKKLSSKAKNLLERLTTIASLQRDRLFFIKKLSK